MSSCAWRRSDPDRTVSSVWMTRLHHRYSQNHHPSLPSTVVHVRVSDAYVYVVVECTWYVRRSYGSPVSLPCMVDLRAPRLQASQPGTVNSRYCCSQSGYLSSAFLNLGFHVEPATSESRIPSNFLRVIFSGTEKYCSVIDVNTKKPN